MSQSQSYDLLIVGGGIHGAGIARDAAGRGLRVALCEQGDFAGATSSTSSKLIHGGLRYLEYGAFRLVRDALHERETLLRIAPHIAHPLRFVVPHVPEMRPAWMVRLGLLIYDHLSARVTLPASGAVDLQRSAYGAPLNPRLRKGFEYSDGWIDDARLTILNVQDAAQKGAAIFPRARVIGAHASAGAWHATLSIDEQSEIGIDARVIVNCAGPWIDELRAKLLPDGAPRTRLVQGSHIVTRALYVGEHAYLLQNNDRRVVFLLPFEATHTLIGTTDVATRSPLAPARAEASEVQYLCAAASRFLREPLTAKNVTHSFVGIRTLWDDAEDNPSAVTRDYTLLLEHADAAPMLSIIGGKLTTYRVVAEKTLAKLRPYLPKVAERSWTERELLPGGDLGTGGMPALCSQLASRYPRLPRELLSALARRHGSLAFQVLREVEQEAELGTHFGGCLYAREVDYVIEHEWARSAEDVLWRRTKEGLSVDALSAEALEEYVRSRVR
jgi:glycerol-3-phosphate dehydrogenase